MELTNEKLIKIINSDPCPAREILNQYFQERLTDDDIAEAELYFASQGGLQAVAQAEHDFCEENDI